MNRVLAYFVAVVLSQVLPHSALAQGSPESRSSDPYPPGLSLSEASALFDTGELQCALWYCVNLFEKSPKGVVDLVCKQRYNIDDIPSEIASSFVSLFPIDSISSLSGAQPVVSSSLEPATNGRSTEELICMVERELLSRYFLDSLMVCLSEDFVPYEGSVEGDWLTRTVSSGYFDGKVKHVRKDLRARTGRSVKDFAAPLYARIIVDVVWSDSAAFVDSLYSGLLESKYIKYPGESESQQYAKSPPFMLIKAARIMIMISERCENYYREDGSVADEKFWPTLTQWASLIKGVRPHTILGCFCGGPVRTLK